MQQRQDVGGAIGDFDNALRINTVGAGPVPALAIERMPRYQQLQREGAHGWRLDGWWKQRCYRNSENLWSSQTVETQSLFPVKSSFVSKHAAYATAICTLRAEIGKDSKRVCRFPPFSVTK